MNPRQRRGAMLMALSVIVAVVVFVVISRYVADVESKVGNSVSVYRVTKDVNAYTRLDKDNLEKVDVPQRWASDAAQLNEGEVQGRVTAVPMSAGSVITDGQLVPAKELNPDEREIAINVDAVTGIAGRVRPGDRVDAYAVYADVPGLPKQARVLLKGVRVVSVGGRQQIADNETKDLKDTVPVTLALNGNDALAITYANAFAQEVRLVGLPASAAQDRRDELSQYDASLLGGQAIPEGQR